MPLVNADFVKETSTTTGTGTYDLAGAVAGFRTFVAGIGTGNTCWYSATDGTNWETGIGTVTDAATDTLARTTIISSSNAGSAVSWGAGTKTIRCSLPSDGLNQVPQNSQSGAYTLVLGDAGRNVIHPSADTTARTFTIPANSSVAYPIGTAITFVNQNGAGVLTIAITTDTLRLAGAGTTGSRTLAANGIATALKLTATEWIIAGTGLSGASASGAGNAYAWFLS